MSCEDSLTCTTCQTNYTKKVIKGKDICEKNPEPLPPIPEKNRKWLIYFVYAGALLLLVVGIIILYVFCTHEDEQKVDSADYARSFVEGDTVFETTEKSNLEKSEESDKNMDDK